MNSSAPGPAVKLRPRVYDIVNRLIVALLSCQAWVNVLDLDRVVIRLDLMINCTYFIVCKLVICR